MSALWKAVSIVTLVAVLLTGAYVVVSDNRTATAAPAAVEAGSDVSGITVSATGEVKAQPDTAYISLGVQTSAPTAREAMDKNSAAMTAVQAKLEAMGIARTDMQTSNISLYPRTRLAKPDDPNSVEIVSYFASNTLNVTVKNLSKVGEIVDAAISAGANNVGGIRFAVRDDAKLRDQALTAALKEARAKADLAASGLGIKVTGVKSVTVEGTGGSQVVYVEYARAAGMAAEAAVPVQPGELTFTASVRVTFGF